MKYDFGPDRLRILFLLVLLSSSSEGSNTSNSTDAGTHAAAFEDDELFSQPLSDFLEDAPGAPIITSSSRTSKPHSYDLSWEAKANMSEIRCFKIRYKKESSNESWSYNTVPANVSQLRLLQLASSSLYQVQIIRLTDRGKASRVAMSSFRTGSANKKSSNSAKIFPRVPIIEKKSNHSEPATQVPGAPSTPRVAFTSATSVSLTWLPRSNGGSPITGYKIQVRRLGGKRGGKWRTKKKLPADIKTFNIKGLKRAASYKFRVLAINAVGESAPSASALRRPKSADGRQDAELFVAPDVRADLLSNGSVFVRWTYGNVPAESFDGFIVKYAVDSKRRKRKIRDPRVLSFEITKPVHTQLYTVTVQAFSSREHSPESFPLKFKIVRDHAMKRNVIRFEGGRRDISPYTGDMGAGNDDYIGRYPNVPRYNDKVKATSGQRDIAIIIAASIVCFIIVILLSSCTCYHRQKKQRKKACARSEAGANKQPSSICAKLLGCLCAPGKPEALSGRPPSSPPRCSCYSGTNSPVRVGTSCLQSNRTSMSHGAIPENGVVAYPRVPGNPMYTVYYDCSPSPQTPYCLAAPGIPIGWLRGEGEFCHIVPRDSRSKPNDDSKETGNDEPEPSANTALLTRSSSSNHTEAETEEMALDPVAAVAESDGERGAAEET